MKLIKNTECEDHTEAYDGNLIYCKNVGNEDNYEGNCQVEYCPLHTKIKPKFKKSGYFLVIGTPKQ